jgi:hypothetical protein
MAIARMKNSKITICKFYPEADRHKSIPALMIQARKGLMQPVIPV